MIAQNLLFPLLCFWVGFLCVWHMSEQLRCGDPKWYQVQTGVWPRNGHPQKDWVFLLELWSFLEGFPWHNYLMENKMHRTIDRGKNNWEILKANQESCRALILLWVSCRPLEQRSSVRAGLIGCLFIFTSFGDPGTMCSLGIFIYLVNHSILKLHDSWIFEELYKRLFQSTHFYTLKLQLQVSKKRISHVLYFSYWKQVM